MKKEGVVISCSVAPWLSVTDGIKALTFYKAAFGAIEVYRLDVPDTVVARLSVNGAEFWLSEGAPEGALGGGSIRMILTVPNPDTVVAQAVASGATVVFPVGEEHGWRLGRVIDPFGLHWEIGHQIKI